MNSCDSPDFLRRVAATALSLGFINALAGQKRLTSDKLMSLLGLQLGYFVYRRFHQESLSRVYGTAFTCRDKLAYAKQRGL